jgi:hypothetical protein
VKAPVIGLRGGGGWGGGGRPPRREPDLVELRQLQAERYERIAEEEAREHGEGEGRAVGEVARPDERHLHLHAEHAAVRSTQQLRSDVVGRGEHEHEQEGAHRRRRDQRQHDPAPALHAPGAEVLRRLEVGGLKRGEPGVEHENHVGQEDVDQRDGHREAVVEQEVERLVDHSERLEPSVDRAVPAEHRSPGEDAHQIAGEERGDDQEQDDAAPATGRVAQPVGHRKRDQNREGGGQQTHHERVPPQGAVDVGLEDLLVVVDRERRLHVVERTGQERIDTERHQRRDEEDEQADHRRRREHQRPHPQGGFHQLPAFALISCQRFCTSSKVTNSSDSTGGLL